jgi:hypothetical protein
LHYLQLYRHKLRWNFTNGCEDSKNNKNFSISKVRNSFQAYLQYSSVSYSISCKYRKSLIATTIHLYNSRGITLWKSIKEWSYNLKFKFWKLWKRCLHIICDFYDWQLFEYYLVLPLKETSGFWLYWEPNLLGLCQCRLLDCWLWNGFYRNMFFPELFDSNELNYAEALHCSYPAVIQRYQA